MKFKFSLAPVLKVRKHQEKLQKQKLAEELKKKQEINYLKSEVQEKLNSYLEHKNNSGKAENVQSVQRHGRHVLQVHELMRKINTDLKEAENSVTRQRKKLEMAHKNRHILEKVREMEKSVHYDKVMKLEQKNLDEIATQSYSR
ncbi:MAG: hypothetical protein JJU46_08195 [Balneolaceae bacterium]|nr:hypothetical protein [Balneolaceae bacterium]MCH8547903.1 hypothetical protein [Balneolaceae bacterium]